MNRLDLIFKRGGDEKLKKFLSAKVKETKDMLEQCSSQLVMTEEALRKQQINYEGLFQQFQATKEELNDVKKTFQLQEQANVNEIIKKHHLEMKELETSDKRKYDDMERKQQKTIDDLSQKVSELSDNLNGTTVHRDDLDKASREMTNKIDSFEHEVGYLKENNQELRT